MGVILFMAHITDKKAIFFVTSPRTPFKLLKEIELLINNYGGKKWNKETQASFAKELSKAYFFEGIIRDNWDFAARDRINRAPKSLGFVNLYPRIQLTPAGELFLTSKRPQEIFTRQMLKFQLPSPYHIDKSNRFSIKPYLELFRLVYELGGLTKNEIAIFFMQLINFKKYDLIKTKILEFRKSLKDLGIKKQNVKEYIGKIFINEIKQLFKDEISKGIIKIRESKEDSIKNFINTKRRNHLDYADAAVRYLRATNLVSIHARTHKIYIPEEKYEDIQYILEKNPREHLVFKNEEEFKSYLFAPDYPTLLSDDKPHIINTIIDLDPQKDKPKLQLKDLEELKDLRDFLILKRNEKIISEEFDILKTYKKYNEIIQTYKEITARELLDAPLMMEWNTWRAFAMLDYGNIKGQFSYDEVGMPLNNAPGNTPDIICEYNDFDIIVEVTLSTGQRQYEMEGEPVARHLGKHRINSKKDSYCIFIAQYLSPATIAFFYSLNKIPINFYGGISKIIPISLDNFIIMLSIANSSETKPKSINLKRFVKNSHKLVVNSGNEEDWYSGILKNIRNWSHT